MKIDRKRLEQGRLQKIKGDQGATDASHVLDAALVVKLLNGSVKENDLKPLQNLMKDFLNLPLKECDENRKVEKKLDQEIMNARGTQTKLSPAAKDRVKAKLAIVKGLALDHGVSEEIVKSILCQLGSLIGPDGKPIDHKYPSCWKGTKPYNLWSEDSSITGLTKAGDPDRETAEGRARIAKTFEEECGMTKTKEASERTKIGKELGMPKDEYKPKYTGMKKDGTPDLRTELGVKALEQQTSRFLEKEEKAEEQRRQEQQRRQDEEEHRRREQEEQRRHEEQRRQEQQRRQDEEEHRRRQEEHRRREQEEKRQQEEQRRQQLLFEEQRREEQRREEQRRRAESMFSQQSFSQPSFGFPGTHVGFHSSTGSANGRELFMGPRGGVYHFSRNGNRVYHWFKMIGNKLVRVTCLR